MTKRFKLEKLDKEDQQVFSFHLGTTEEIESFKKACELTGKKPSRLAREMIVHCLKEAGVLKGSK